MTDTVTEQDPSRQPAPGLPLFSLSRHSPWRTDPKALEAFYAKRRQVWWNVFFIGLSTLGWNTSLTLVTPLVAIRLLDLGVRENVQATLASGNLWAVSFLVMLFGWMSDHTISRLGRRKPYLLASAPFIIAVIVLFPFLAAHKLVWLLLALQVVYLFFMDVKQSTFALIMIDCVPRPILARTKSILAIIGAATGFAVNWNAGYLLDLGEWVPYVLGGGVMAVTTAAALLVKEPPVYNPPTESFKPWSTFKVAARDKRVFLLIAGVALVLSYKAATEQWIWFWSKESLGLSRKDIFQALSWGGLINIVLGYPTGWLIDRFGGLKVVIIYVALAASSFVLALFVHDKTGLIVFVLMRTIMIPLYLGADIMIFKSAHPKDIGSITSTTSCIRNAFLGVLALVTGWAIYWTDHNYLVGFGIGLGLTVVGLGFFLVFSRVTRDRPLNLDEEQPAAEEADTAGMPLAIPAGAR